MGVPTSEVGYTAAMLRREDNEVHKDMWHWEEKKNRKERKEGEAIAAVEKKGRVLHPLTRLSQSQYKT